MADWKGWTMTHNEIVNAIANDPFFSGASEDALTFLADHAAPRRLAADEVLFRFGASAENFYLIREGAVTLEVAALEGPSLELQTLGENAILGWSWLISPYRWSFQARAELPSELLEFDGKAVLEHCEDEPAFGYDMFKRFSGLMSKRLQEARQRMIDEWRPDGFA